MPIDPQAGAESGDSRVLPFQLAGERVDFAAPSEAKRGDSFVIVALVGGGPCGGLTAILACLDAGSDYHALGALFDLAFKDGEVIAGFLPRPDHAGQHCPLLGISIHCRGSCDLVEVPGRAGIGAAGTVLGAMGKEAGTAWAAPALAVHSAASWKTAPFSASATSGAVASPFGPVGPSAAGVSGSVT